MSEQMKPRQTLDEAAQRAEEAIQRSAPGSPEYVAATQQLASALSVEGGDLSVPGKPIPPEQAHQNLVDSWKR